KAQHVVQTLSVCRRAANFQIKQQADQFAFVVIVRGEVAEVPTASAVSQPRDGTGIGERYPSARLARLQAGDLAAQAAQVILNTRNPGAAAMQRAVIVREAFCKPQLARVLLFAVIVGQYPGGS